MSRAITRRAMLTGAGAVAAIALAGGGYAAYALLPGTRSPEAEAAEYAKLLADVHDDYVNGRVVEHEGWILSQHEFDTIEARQGERQEAGEVKLS